MLAINTLHTAIEHMNTAEVERLLGEGFDPNLPDPDLGGFRPLHLAVDIECEDALRRNDAGEADARPRAVLTRLLVEAGADLSLPDGQGRSAYDLAVSRRQGEAVELFRRD